MDRRLNSSHRSATHRLTHSWASDTIPPRRAEAQRNPAHRWAEHEPQDPQATLGGPALVDDYRPAFPGARLDTQRWGTRRRH